MIVGAESQCGSFHVAWGTMLLLVGLCLVCTYKTTDSEQDSSPHATAGTYSSLALPPQHIPFFLHNNKRLAKLCKEDLLCPFKVSYLRLGFWWNVCWSGFKNQQDIFPTMIVFKRAVVLASVACDFITNIRCCGICWRWYEQVVSLSFVCLCWLAGCSAAQEGRCWGYEKRLLPWATGSAILCAPVLTRDGMLFFAHPTQRCLYGPLFGDCSQWSRLIFIVLKNWSINILLTISFCGDKRIGITWGY